MNITIDGYNINYVIDGEGGETVVILQGWGTTLQVYQSMAQLLSSKYRVVRLDLPGFGSSDEPREPWSVEDFVEFFLKFLRELHIDRAILIGHSYGGRMIIRLASRDNPPIEIPRIVLVDSAGVLPVRTTKQKLKIARYKVLKKVMNAAPVEKLFPELVESWRNRQGSADYRNASPVMRQCLVKAVNEDLTDLLEKIRCEVLLIWGSGDTATPMRDAHIMEEKIPNAGLAVIENAGHYSFLDQPAVFNSIMTSYFKL